MDIRKLLLGISLLLILGITIYSPNDVALEQENREVVPITVNKDKRVATAALR